MLVDALLIALLYKTRGLLMVHYIPTNSVLNGGRFTTVLVEVTIRFDQIFPHMLIMISILTDIGEQCPQLLVT